MCNVHEFWNLYPYLQILVVVLVYCVVCMCNAYDVVVHKFCMI